ncbi:anaerobic ribonucleoside-triphosphate reductase activating protein [Arthrospiribacter ruber]|uniref:Anaerobic ribonucleoside-triphosphate reductase activating protein n=1 Tax=Arthrospiribacter ruber TaxID=2487934 RepID=A0A951J0F4_9BACT|nr:anaerobic ribonucleoside-triphosphate reductase activating protein [Arthrospiribacter ruber]MBW3469784.1 anaerobic ribonucleoside-triphosphate reductase activating protein [Arthrospiribacter ruber]
MVKKPIYSITPFTLLDYPDHTACILWFAGCNMRCGYCYNPEIVRGKGKVGFDEVLSFLEKRKNLLDGVVFSGGECTMHQDLPYYASEVKRLGMKVKIDTNGSRPHVLEDLLYEGLVDYVALDFKALPEDFESITHSDFFEQFKESLEVLIGHDVPFEIRTTVHSELINVEKLSKMASFLRDQGYKGKYYLQHFVGEKETIKTLSHSKKPNLAFTDYPELELVWRN